MTTWREVQIIHEAHPDWGSTRIAKVLDCGSAYVRATAQRRGWKIGRDPIPGRPVSIPRAEVKRYYTAGLSRSAIAKKLGTSAAYISQIVWRLRQDGDRVPELRRGRRPSA